MPYSWVRASGRFLGLVSFYFMREFRKRSLSNVALAKSLDFGKEEILKTAKKSFQNLAINCLEYPKFAHEKNISKIIQCENPETANELYAKGHGIIFFCGHQSNWEVLFLDGTTRMKGVAIGKSIKNKRLYQWIVSIRERHGGTIIAPRNAVREGFRALKKGAFLGIVGDQGMPDSGYSFPFLGRRAWTSTAPALLSYRTNSPIIFAETRRVDTGYKIRYSEPIWPDLTQPMEEEVTRLMDSALTLLQESIKDSPGEWLWQHNRWKQETPQNIYKQFRHDCISIILPQDKQQFEALASHLPTLKKIYEVNFLIFIVPEEFRNHVEVGGGEVIYYRKMRETLLDDFRFKLVFNFTDYKPIYAHYESLSAFDVLDLAKLKELAKPHLPASLEGNLSEIFLRALCRPGTLWTPEEKYAR
jgi:KDO2-lipid IV(A) lauroyltransferase